MRARYGPGEGRKWLAEAQNDEIDPELTSLIKAKFFVGATGRGLADPPGARFPGHPQ